MDFGVCVLVQLCNGAEGQNQLVLFCIISLLNGALLRAMLCVDQSFMLVIVVFISLVS